MRRYIRDLRPTSVFDLAAMVALYRPGPMDNIPAYIRRKHGEEKVTYLHPLLEPYLNRTYGVFVYQEDIMSASTALAGFTGPEADMLGYAIRKKKAALMSEMREKFVRQAAERGVKPPVIDAVFAAFQPFERYGFNKAHATCYGLIAYQTAYLKANYTVDYMTSVLTAFRDNEEKVAAAVAECRRLGIEVRPPDVHRSFVEFTVEDDAIRFGLLAVKNVGEGAIESIIAARQADGEFRSLADFCSRVDLRLANKRVLESLIKVGAMNRFGHAAQLLEALDDAMAAGGAAQRDRTTGQTALFDMGSSPEALERPLPQVPEALSQERLRWEKELLGLYLSEHPLGAIADQLAQYVTAYSGDLKDESLDGQRVVMGGIVTGLRTVTTRNKETMAVATLEDLQGTLEVVVFPRMYATAGGTFAEGAILLVAGRVDHRGEEASLLADAVWVWEEAAARGPEAIAQEVAAGDRRGGSGRRFGGGFGHDAGNGNPAATATATARIPGSPVPATVPPAGPASLPAASAVAGLRPRSASRRCGVGSHGPAARQPAAHRAGLHASGRAAALRVPSRACPPARRAPLIRAGPGRPRIARPGSRRAATPRRGARRCGPCFRGADRSTRGAGLRHPERALHARRRYGSHRGRHGGAESHAEGTARGHPRHLPHPPAGRWHSAPGSAERRRL